MSKTSKTILVIDDSNTNVNILKDILSDKYCVFTSLDGKLALKIADEEKIDLVLLDIVMPNMDGFEVCEKLKSNPKTQDIPVIFITADTNDESLERAYFVGGVDYIRKPFNITEVLSRVNIQLSLAEQKYKLEQTLKENISLLNQYKQVVDITALVSKTDIKGRITYANDAFVKTSGFSKEELLGNYHRIVRHPDMHDDVYTQMWDTIKEKKIWHGELKNMKKDKSTYIVNATVMPIIDSNNQIKEFISVRHDITELHNLKKEIIDTQKEVIFTMGEVCETRSKETGNHVKRVAEYSRILATHCGLDKDKIQLIVDASPMHDIGKIGIPDNILNKPAKLTEDEFNIMKNHTEIGYKMLKHSSRPLLKTAAIVAFEHHERWDGFGYPRGLKKDNISIEGRITALADVFDALGSNRCYKSAWSDERIFDYFKEQRENQFDPFLVDIFFKEIDSFFKIRETFKDT